MSSLCEITNKVKAIAPFAKADEVAIGIEPFGQLDVEVQRSQTMTQGKTGQVVFIAISIQIIHYKSKDNQ